MRRAIAPVDRDVLALFASAAQLAHMKVAALALCAALISAPALAQTCPSAPDQSQLSLDYAAFDAAGWRNLLGQGCADAAIAQLAAYRDANAARLAPEDLRELHFHIGQTLAFSGRDSASIAHFEAARGGPDEWAAYVDAALAFLKRDADALAAARTRYAAAQGASAMRVAVINGFLACADASYSEAVHCGMRSAH